MVGVTWIFLENLFNIDNDGVLLKIINLYLAKIELEDN